jgi:hypothetical protein
VQVRIGNSATKEAWRDKDGQLRHRPVDGARVTTVTVPDTYTFAEAFAAITAGDGVWNHHSQGDDVAGSTPDWVEADDPDMTTVLASALNCPAGRPAKWKGLG